MKKIIAIDLYNQAITGGVTKTLSNKATDSDHIPCVIIAFTTEMTPKVDGGVLRSPCEAEITRTHNV